MRKSLQSAALALALPGLFAAAAPAMAATVPHGPAAAIEMTAAPESANHDRRWSRDRYYGDGYRNDGYYGRSAYREGYARQSWRGRDGRYYCRRDDGTTGLVVGGVLGGVLGNEIAGRGGDRTLGTILGAAGGALLGREVDRGGSRCR